MSNLNKLISYRQNIKAALALGATLLFSPAFAETVVVTPEVVTVPVSANLKDALGRDKTLLTTAAIKDSQGKLAKGMHNIDFSLADTAPYALIVDGNTVQPGQSIRFSKNLSLSASAVTLSVKPAVSGVVGTASYSMSLPEIKIAVCPEGMTEKLNNCQQILFADPVLGCDAGYQLSGSQCVQTITAPKQVQCADGYTQNGNQCVGGPAVAPKEGCAAGFSLNANNECEAVKYTPITSCPVGYSDAIYHCEKTTTILKVNAECPTGYDVSPIDPNYCIQTDRVAKSTYCEGVENTGVQQCTGTGEQKVCATLDHTKAACEVKTYSLTVNECGPDYTLTNGQCQLNKNYTISVTCPATYTQVHGTGTCEKVNTTAATPKCPATYTLNGTTCSKADSLPIESCPSGYYYLNSKCNQMVSANINCSAGYTWNGTICSKTETSAATGECTSPYTWSGTTCQQTQTATGTYGCPADYTWNGSKCVSPYRTDIKPTNWSCPYGDTARPSYPTGPNQMVCYENQSIGCPAGYSNSIDDPATCFDYAGGERKVNGVCPTSSPYPYVDNQFMCTTTPNKKWAIAATDSSTSCPSGYNKDSIWGCVKNTPRASIGYHCCESGLTYNSSTYKMEGHETSSKVNTCPSGYTYVSGTTCRKVTTQTPSSYSCPADWTLNGSNCNRILTVSETRTCNTGYTIATPDYPTQCYKNTYTNNVGNCKPSYTLSGITCNGTLSQAAYYECAQGWTVSGDKCNQTLNAAASVNCANPFTDAGSNCSMTMTDIVNNICVAPYQWSAADGKCKAVITTPKL